MENRCACHGVAGQQSPDHSRRELFEDELEDPVRLQIAVDWKVPRVAFRLMTEMTAIIFSAAEDKNGKNDDVLAATVGEPLAK